MIRGRGVSTSVPCHLRAGLVNLSGRSSDVRPARRALASLAVTALLLTPIRLGAVTTASDAAIFIGVRDSIAARPALDVRDPRAYVQGRASRSGWAGRGHRCIAALVDRENRAWNPTARNRQGSSAYGLFQILHTPPGTPLPQQWDRFERYLNSRYHGDPCAALTHSLNEGWY